MAGADLRIIRVRHIPDPLRTSRESRLEVAIDNVGTIESSPYTLSVYNESGNRLDYHSKRSGLSTIAYNVITLEFRIRERGMHTLRFVIEGGESTHNEWLETLFWYDEGEEGGIGGPDCDLGTGGYIHDINILEANSGARIALQRMMDDFNSYSSSIIHDFKYNLYANFDAYCNKFDDLIKKSGLIRKEIVPGPSGLTQLIIEDDFKEFHYFRNELNKSPTTLSKLMSEKDKWEMLPYYKSAFHMFDTAESRNGLLNLKFVSKGSQRHEAVYNEFGILLNEINDYRNMGTYNYVGADDVEGHKLYDVEPYYRWGNVDGKGEGDSFIAALNRAWAFVQNSSAIEYYNSYATQFGLPQFIGITFEELDRIMKDLF